MWASAPTNKPIIFNVTRRGRCPHRPEKSHKNPRKPRRGDSRIARIIHINQRRYCRSRRPRQPAKTSYNSRCYFINIDFLNYLSFSSYGLSQEPISITLPSGSAIKHVLCPQGSVVGSRSEVAPLLIAY